MEKLDIYTEDGQFIGSEDRHIVHRDALWHKTVHCWLYDMDGHVYFQIRKDRGTLYTTASGHVAASESVKEAFGREVKEEIGIDVDYQNAVLVNVVKFVMDRENGDGTIFKDRAFANVYVCDFEKDYDNFHFDEEEVLGLVRFDAQEAYNFFKNPKGTITGEAITSRGSYITSAVKAYKKDDFLCNEGETLLKKYGAVLEKIIAITTGNYPVVGQTYRHFKGNVVTILAVAKNTETQEEMVVYNHDGDIWVRPLAMFISEVDHKKYPDVTEKKRFTLMK